MRPTLSPPVNTDTPFAYALRAHLFTLTPREVEDLQLMLWRHKQTLTYASRPHDEYIRLAVGIITRAEPELPREDAHEILTATLAGLSGAEDHMSKSRDFGRGVAHAVRTIRRALDLLLEPDNAG